MPTYQFKIKLEDQPTRDLEHTPNKEPTLEEIADAIEEGVEAAFGIDFTVAVYDGSRPDR